MRGRNGWDIDVMRWWIGSTGSKCLLAWAQENAEAGRGIILPILIGSRSS